MAVGQDRASGSLHRNTPGILLPEKKGILHRIQSNKIVFIGAGLGALSWVLEALIHVFLLGEGHLIEEIFSPDLHHFLIRASIFIIFCLFSVYVQRSVKEHRRAEEAIQNALTESQQRQAEVSALLEGAGSILRHGEFREAARSIFYSCKNLLGATAGYVALTTRDGTGNEVLFLDPGGLPCSVDPSLPMPIRGLRGEAYRTGKTVYDNDFPGNEWMKYMPEGHVRLENVLFAPLKIEGRAVGLLGLANKPGGFHEKDAAMATAFSELAAVSLMNSRTLQSLEDAEVEHKTILNTAMDGFWLTDTEGRFLEVNEAYCLMTGYRRDELLTMNIRDIEAKETADETGGHMQRVIDMGGDRFETIHRCKDGRRVDIEVSANYMGLGGGRFFVFLRDITDRKRAEKELLRRHSELAALYEVASAIGRTIELDRLFSDVLNTLTGIDLFRVERKGGFFVVEGDRMRLVSHLGHDDLFLDLHREMRVGECLCGIAAKTGEVILCVNCEHDPRHTVRYPGMSAHGHVILPLQAKGRVVGVLYLYLPAGTSLGDDKVRLLDYIGNMIGIAIDNARLFEKTKELSLHDPLTGLANRRLLEVVLDRSFATANRLGLPISVIMSDIDNFKKYNDTHGHAAGDTLLARISGIITREVRGMDLAVRYGGEEFLILLPETDQNGARNLAERIRNAVENDTDVSISLGISSFRKGMKKRDLIKNADDALYRAKQSGKNRVVVNG